MSTETVHVEYRIMSRKPRETRWTYRAFTGASGRDLDRITARAITAAQESPGWRFKVEQRTVRISCDDWLPVTVSRVAP